MDYQTYRKWEERRKKWILTLLGITVTTLVPIILNGIFSSNDFSFFSPFTINILLVGLIMLIASMIIIWTYSTWMMKKIRKKMDEG